MLSLMLASEQMSRLTHHSRNLITVLIVFCVCPLVLARGCASCRFMASLGFNIPSDAHFSKAIACSTNITGADLSHFSSRRSVGTARAAPAGNGYLALPTLSESIWTWFALVC